MISDVLTSPKYSEYLCIHEVSLFEDFRYFDVFRNLFGPHIDHFGRSSGTTLVIVLVAVQTLIQKIEISMKF